MKNVEMQKKAIVYFLAMIFMGSFVFGQDNETITQPENAKIIKDVIVRNSKYFDGFQTKILDVNDTYIYYIQYKTRGREKEKKIKQSKVALTITFDENAKAEKNLAQVEFQDFLCLPAYYAFGTTIPWCVFGTGTTNLPGLETVHPDICKDFIKGRKLTTVASGMYSISYLLGGIPLIIVGGIIEGSGKNKIINAFTNYYNDCVSLEVCEKYGIVITPYNLNKAITLK